MASSEPAAFVPTPAVAGVMDAPMPAIEPLLSAPPDATLEALLRLTREITGCPVALLAVLDPTHVRCMAEAGLGRRELPRAQAWWCGALEAGAPARLDAPSDPAAGEMRFCAAQPVYVAGACVASLVVLDVRRRDWSGPAESGLRDLAALAQSLLSTRLRDARALPAAASAHRDGVLETIGLGTWDWFPDAGELHTSPSLVALVGLASLHRHDAARWIDRVHPADREGLRESLVAHLRGQNGHFEHEFRLRRSDDSSLWALALGKVAQRGADGRALRVVGTLTETTQRRQSERRRRDGQVAELARRNRSQFLSRMNHEMRTPLNAMIGFAQLLGEPQVARDSQRVAEYAGHALAAGRRLLDLVDDVLDLQRVEDGTLQLDRSPVALGKITARAIERLHDLADAREIRVIETIDPQAIVLADRMRLLQVLMGLLSNAIVYNHPGGTVHLTTSAAHADRWQLAVQDTGPGLTESQMQRLFQPFERLGWETSDVQGTGLGLIVARALVERMGGSLSLSSHPAAGTQAVVELPCAGLRPTGDDTAAASVIDVLYVEDNRVNALLFSEAMRTLGPIQVRVAEDGHEALEMARRARPDVLVLDAHLPGQSGYEVLERLRSEAGLIEVPAFMCSADALPEDLARARDAGFVSYWTKPIDFKQVLADLGRLRIPPSSR